jgi:hypothetical protein
MWRDPDTGQLFEVQLHTPESFEAKTITHDWFGEERLPATTPERRAELAELQRPYFDAVPEPPGARDLSLPAHAVKAPVIPPVNLDALVNHGRKPFQAVGYVGVGTGADLQPSEAR